MKTGEMVSGEMVSGAAPMHITKDELRRCKRATVVLAEVFKVAYGGKQAPAEMREDMRTLAQVLRRLEKVAS